MLRKLKARVYKTAREYGVALCAMCAVFCFGVPVGHAQQIDLQTICADLSSADADSDGVDYTAGVDAQQQPVVPADINTPVQAIQYPIEIPLAVEALDWVGAVNGDVLLQNGLTAQDLVNVKLFEDGRVEYNGRDISDRISHSCKGADKQDQGSSGKTAADQGEDKPGAPALSKMENLVNDLLSAPADQDNRSVAE